MASHCPLLVLATCCLGLAPDLWADARAPSQRPRLNDRPETTLHSRRWQGVIRQAFDYSCGTGSIANLLSLAGAKPPDERELIRAYADKYSEDHVQKAMQAGFSLLDLKLMLELLGYRSSGVRYEPGTMPEEARPMIVYLVVKGYRHFAVFGGTEDGQVLLLDPARGRIRISVQRFLKEWDGTALLILDELPNLSMPNDQNSLTRAQDAARRALFQR